MNITNHLRIPLFMGAGGIFFGTICLLLFLTFGGGSQRAWSALVVVVGSCAGLLLILFFDLQGSKEITRISTEYTFDRAIPQIRQWMYARSLGDRYATEVLANYTALKADPSIFDGDIEILNRDMILFSLTAYLETRQRDWQTHEENYHDSLGTLTTWVSGSNPANPETCTKVLLDDIHKMLRDAGNPFAGANPVVPVPSPPISFPR